MNSVRNTTFSAKDISFKEKNHTKEYNWYKGSDDNDQDISVVSEGVTKGGLKETDIINVAGKVTAGIHNNINVKIDGKVAFDKNITGDGIVRAPTIECNTAEYKNAFKTGTMNYGNELFKRYQEIEKLYNEYASTDKISLSYKAEMDRLINEMEKYGLYDSKDKKVIADLSVDYIELPDMVCSGGNIYINAKDKDSVSGTGMLKAQGAPKINVENNSNLYMKVNDLTVVEPGGDIIFNDLALGQNAKSTLSKVSKVETEASNGSEIRVNENWKNKFDVNYKDPATGETKKTTANPLTNIEINGHISDEYGNVIFYNANKDIVLQGKTAQDSASIDGYQISISAPNGSIAQGYTQGITNIGYTPEAVLKSYANAQESSIINGLDLGNNVSKQTQNTLTEAQIQNYVKNYQLSPQGTNESASGVWLAGGSIYLNGEVINLNGTVQSGYAKYEVVLSDNEKTRIKEIKDNYINAGKPQVTQSYLEQNCRINDSGMKWYKDSDKNIEAYKYVVQAYYNPQTDTIVLEDIQSSGGQIYLTGKIVNTSGGKIFAADGASDIDITNNTVYKLTANTLDVGDRKGFISIMDLAKSDESKGIFATLTEMTSDSTKVWYVTKNGTDKNNPDSTSGKASSYSPKSGLTYNWSTGYKETFEYRYEESYKFTIWGAIDYDKQSSTTMMKKIEDGELSPVSSGKNDKITGRNVETPIVSADNGYSLYFNNVSQYKYGPTSGGYKKYNSWVHFSGTYYSWSEYKYGSTRDYHHSIKADYPISISFLSGNGNINLTTNSDLQLNSDVINKYGDVKLTSSNGSIEQTGGNFYADKIYLSATSGIGSKNAITQKMQSDLGVFSAITTSGDVNLISKNVAGVKDAKLKVSAVTNKGNANVTTDASMLQSGNAVDFKGSRIDLVSNYGSIGTKDALLKINAGQEIVKPGDTLSASVNAKAYGDVALNQSTGDMRIGRIISQNGDAYITSAGSVLDALPLSADIKENQEAERLIAKWKELGIISENGKDNSAEKRAMAIEAYKNSVYTAFSRYTDLKKRFDADKKDTTSESYKEYQKLKERFGKFSSADKWLEAQNKDKNSQWYKLQNEVVYGWTQDALLYAIQDSIINRESGSTITPKSASDANIKARNITINAGGSIGLDEGYDVYDISDLRSAKGLDALKAIAAAEASDVKWGYKGDEVDKNSVTINKVNSIAIDASGMLKASSKGNIYFEEVNNNKVNLYSVKSDGGNVRVYGSKGIYNATSYKEGSDNNIINLEGKDLIIEGGDGSIGTKDVPVTTNMSGYITARSSDFINLYQIGNNAMTFAAVYSGASINIRAINDILSVYNSKQAADELGYIHAKEDITLCSDKGDIGQANGKGLRVKITDNKELAAEANSVYIKGFGENTFNLGKIIARSGDIGIDCKDLDVVLKNDIKAQNLEFKVRSLTQKNGKLTVSKLLNVNSDNGIDLGNFENLISEASLINNKSGNIFLRNNHDLTIYDLINKAENSNINIINEGFVTVKNGLSSNGDLFIWSDGNIDIQKDSTAKNWIGLYSDNGGISVKFLKGGSIDLSAETKGLSADDIISDSYIKADIEEGDINTGNLIAADGNLSLITNNGSISSKNIEAKNDVNVIAYDGKLEVDSIKSLEGDLEAVGYDSLNANSFIANNNFYVGSFGDVVIKQLTAGMGFNSHISDLFDDFKSDELTSILIGKNVKIDNIYVQNDLEAIANGNFKSNKIIIGREASIFAEKNIDINSVKSGENLEITSFGDGTIKINDIYTDQGELSISNEVGNIELENIKAGNDIQLNSDDNGDILLGNVETYNGGSLYSNINNGLFLLQSGSIDGEASIYSEEGNIVLTEINVGKELDVRANDGSIVVGYKTTIGGDATLKSDTKSVILSDAYVKGNMKISAKDYSSIINATVDGSMLMKGDEGGCTANILNVGKDLIINTQIGSIKVENATVGEDTYISVDDNGGTIEITNGTTGKDSLGDLIVEYKRQKIDKDHPAVDINNAEAANKVIINTISNVELINAYAWNGKLEIKAIGDIIVNTINAAKETYIATLAGLVKINNIISGDNVLVSSLGGGVYIENIETLNPEADIDILQWFGDINVINASSARDLQFSTIDGDIHLDKVSSGGNINLNSLGSDITVNETYAAKDMYISSGIGSVNLTKTNIGNNLEIHLNGDLGINNVNVGNNTKILAFNNSVAKINNFTSDNFDLTDKGQSDLDIGSSKIGKANVILNGKANFTDSDIDKLDAEIGKDFIIKDSNIKNINANIGGDLKVNNLTNSQFSTIIKGGAEINSLTSDEVTATIGKNASITDSTIGKLNIEIKGDATITNLTNEEMTAVLNGKSSICDSKLGNIDLTNKGETLIKDSTVNTLTTTNNGNFELTNTAVNILDLNNKTGATASIYDTTVKSFSATNDGELNVNELTGDKLELTSKGNTNIAESDIKNIKANNSGKYDVNKLTSNKLELTSKGDANIVDSTITDINANISGSASINNLVSSQLSFANSGDTSISNTSTNKINITNSGKTNLNNIDVSGSGYFVNKNGNINIDQLTVANNFNLDSTSGKISMSGIDVNKDFNFALAGDSDVNFTDITIGHDFNVYAGKAVLSGSSLKVGNDLHTYTYSKYSAPKATSRAAIKSDSGTARASESEEGFSLILDELDIGGGLYVDNPDVTIKINEYGAVGNDVKIDAGKENIQINKLDVDGGSLDIKGNSGAIKLGKVNVENNTKIKLESGNLDVSDLDSKLDIDFKVGGNITSAEKITSQNSTVNVVAGGNLTASDVEAKGKIDFNAGGNITSDRIIHSEDSTVNAVAGGNLTASTIEAKNNIDLSVGENIISDNKIETQTQSVNMVAGGSVDAYKVLAKQQGNIEAVNGDIIIGQIDGKTLVFKEDTNNRSLRIGKANVETKITAGADYIDIDLIKQDNSNDRLDIDFSLINGHAMDNVVIRDIQTKNGVEMFNLVSTYGNIHVSHEIFNLTRTYLLKKGDLSNTILKFRLYGDSPVYSKDPDIIAFFAPRINHKSFAYISFNDEMKSPKQDYYPLIAKGDYKRMFNQYTVVQDFETLRLSYEERIEDLNEVSNGKLDYRNLTNSKYFYVDNTPEFSSDGESINLEDIDIPVGLEFDSVNGELKAVGSHIKPQPAID